MEFWEACVLSPVSSTAISAWDLSHQTLAGNPSFLRFQFEEFFV